MTWLKRALPAVALLSALGSFMASPAAAQIAGRPLEFSGGLGIFGYDSRVRFQDGPACQFSIGWRAETWFALEATGTYGPSKTDTHVENDASLLYASLDGRFNLRPAEGRVVPYFLAGWGYGRSTITGAIPEELERGAPSLGAGLLYNLMGNSRLYARIQVRDVMLRDRNSFEFAHHTAATAGLHFVFGGKFRDQDLDSVRDWIDRCPNTEIGATVNAEGCPSDADADSVLDGIDKCADTPKGCRVDRNGCPIDADKDGVCDGIDQCANTIAGAKVDAKGCPTDADADSVYDGLDQCENTPKGCMVDDKGCPKDKDGDGVCDGIDTCPDTPAGAQVDDKGCETPASLIEAEMLDRGSVRMTDVTFETGTAKLTAESLQRLDALYAVMARWPELQFQIAAHTDDQGSVSKNQKLSVDRAQAVKDYLTGKYAELDAKRLTVKGYGSTRPLASNSSEAGRALNRRIEIEVVNKAELVKSGGNRRMKK
jgi:outer membrane protein OmpA-like peptidoglycan-associated protein